MAAGSAVAIMTLIAVVLVGAGGFLGDARPATIESGVPSDTAQPTQPPAAEVTSKPSTRRLVVAGPVLSVAAARDLASRWFQARDRARSHEDNKTLHTLETGDAYRVDHGSSNEFGCICGSANHRDRDQNAHRLTAVSVVVPAAPVHTFVAQFESTIAMTDTPNAFTVVFVANEGTWYAAVIALNAAGAAEFHARQGQSPSARGQRYARTVLNRLGAYVYQAHTTGHVPQGAWTGYAPILAAAYATERQDRANSLGRYQHFSMPTAASGYAFPVAEGQLVCGALTNTIVLSLRPGQVFLQPSSRSTWGSMVPPGNYRRLVETVDNEICIIVHPTGTRDVISLHGTMTDLRAGRPTGA
jgi:hypothetical protein